MSGTAASHGSWKTKSIVWVSVGFGVIVLAAANAHLLYVAVSSEPDCVAHFQQGDADGANSFGAAMSTCSSKPPMKTKAPME